MAGISTTTTTSNTGSVTSNTPPPAVSTGPVFPDGTAADARYQQSGYQARSAPSAAWDVATYALGLLVRDPGGYVRASASYGVTPQAYVDTKTTARSAPAAVWAVGKSGVATNGGGYAPAYAGVGGSVDYSHQNAPQLSLTDLACAQNTTTLTSATGGFTAAMVGNYIQIASGTNFVAGFYLVTAYASSNSVTIDRTAATAGAGSAGVGKLGGRLNSPWGAKTAMNSAGVISQFVLNDDGVAGDYGRQTGIENNGVSVRPLFDFSVIAKADVRTGTFDDSASYVTFTNDGSGTNTYSATRANVDRVIDLLNFDQFGNYKELTPVATQALCQATPGSFALVSTTLYVHRADGAAPTYSNTWYLLSLVTYAPIWNATFLPVNEYWGTLNGATIDVLGGKGFNPLCGGANSVATTHVYENMLFRYMGGVTTGYGTSGTQGFAFDSIYGIAILNNCVASCNATDGFNAHNSNNGSFVSSMLTINSTGDDNGRGTGTSCNGHTGHENCSVMDIAGRYRDNRGGSCAYINSCSATLIATLIENDKGDLALGGTIPPTAIRLNDTAQCYTQNIKIVMGQGQIAVNVVAAGASYYEYSPDYISGRKIGVGTYGTWTPS